MNSYIDALKFKKTSTLRLAAENETTFPSQIKNYIANQEHVRKWKKKLVTGNGKLHSKRKIKGAQILLTNKNEEWVSFALLWSLPLPQ